MARHLGWLWAAIAAAACSKAAPPAVQQFQPAAAAAATVGAGDLRADLTADERTAALQGKGLFAKEFTAAEGLGPQFNFASCASCHDKPASGGHGDTAHSARLTLIGEDVDGLPQKHLDGYAPLQPPASAPVSMHKPPPLYGLGLFEALPDAAIADHCGADPALGIRGVANVNPGLHHVNRFGYKAHTSTLQDFIANALNLEMGITNPVERDVRHLRDQDAVPDPETPTSTVELIAAYVRALAPPPPPPADPANEKRFAELGCANCHRPQTAAGVPAYTDLCVHDLGPAFDNRMRDFLAGPSQWRTAPLWGLRWRDKYFHDDRASDLDAAVRAHGGEAAQVVGRFAALAEPDRAAFLRWLKTL